MERAHYLLVRLWFLCCWYVRIGGKQDEFYPKSSISRDESSNLIDLDIFACKMRFFHMSQGMGIENASDAHLLREIVTICMNLCPSFRTWWLSGRPIFTGVRPRSLHNLGSFWPIHCNRPQIDYFRFNLGKI